MSDLTLIERQKMALQEFDSTEAARSAQHESAARERLESENAAQQEYSQAEQRAEELLARVENEYNAARSFFRQVHLEHLFGSITSTRLIDVARLDAQANLVNAVEHAKTTTAQVRTRVSELEQTRLYHSKLTRGLIGLLVVVAVLVILGVIVLLILPRLGVRRLF